MKSFNYASPSATFFSNKCFRVAPAGLFEKIDAQPEAVKIIIKRYFCRALTYFFPGKKASA